ncbi:hypothetical protein CVT24_001796 [Panaeolus cyanescens]|uniref:Uncharacterized protein n=1 Tax=Panaeolus cyanescens TaxID=181874 RepID=A0A409YFQ5_9AGAR|nr:hypothetical protein CVT24_001796 [Panaeolus cyanescens]
MTFLPASIQAMPLAVDHTNTVITKRGDTMSTPSLFARGLVLPEKASEDGHYNIYIVMDPRINSVTRFTPAVKAAGKTYVQEVAKKYKATQGKPATRYIVSTRTMGFSGYYDWNVIQSMKNDAKITKIEAEGKGTVAQPAELAPKNPLPVLPVSIQAIPLIVNTPQVQTLIMKRDDMVYPPSLFSRAVIPEKASPDGHYRIELKKKGREFLDDNKREPFSVTKGRAKMFIEDEAKKYAATKGSAKFIISLNDRVPLSFAGFYSWDVIQTMKDDGAIARIVVEERTTEQPPKEGFSVAPAPNQLVRTNSDRSETPALLFPRKASHPNTPSKEGYYRIILTRGGLGKQKDDAQAKAKANQRAEAFAKKYKVMYQKPSATVEAGQFALSVYGYYSWSVLMNISEDPEVSSISAVNPPQEPRKGS